MENRELQAKEIIVGMRVIIEGDDVDEAFQEAVGLVTAIGEDGTIYVQTAKGVYPAEIFEVEPA